MSKQLYGPSHASAIKELRKNNPSLTRKQIAEAVGTSLAFVKRTLLDSPELKLDPAQRQNNALTAKLAKNPNALSDMRSRITSDHRKLVGKKNREIWAKDPQKAEVQSEKIQGWWKSLDAEARREYLQYRTKAMIESQSWKDYRDDSLAKTGVDNIKTRLSFAANGVETYNELMHSYALKKKGAYLGGYIDIKTKCRWRCAKGHEFDMKPGNVREDQWCPRCAFSGTSKGCQQIIDFIRTLRPELEVAVNDRKILGGKELDIWIPELKLAIEYCGLHWHGEGLENKASSRTQHLDKLDSCEALDIRLITVFSDEWFFRQPAVRGYIQAVLGAKLKVCGARTLLLASTKFRGVRSFLEAYHIQGASGYYGYSLSDGDGIVAVATFRQARGAHRSLASVGSWELVRYCVKAGVSVPGGLARIMALFIKEHSPKIVLSFSDRRWSQGRIYGQNGFASAERLRPSYSYFYDGSEGPRYHKSSFTKARLSSLGATGADEWTMAQSLGLDRIWDCGLDKWILSVS